MNPEIPSPELHDLSNLTRFNFARIPLIHFGAGTIRDLPSWIQKFGHRVIIVTGSKSFRESKKWEDLKKTLNARSIKWSSITVKGEPSPRLIDDTVHEFYNQHINVVLAIGGGSVLDAGKAISAMLPLREPVVNYLEGIGTGQEHPGTKIPFIALPTTAGTGSEATKNAVLRVVGKSGFKRSLRHENFVPDVAIIDPELMITCPPDITAACGMDAFTQLLESYLSTKSNPMTDALAWSGMEYVKNNLTSACTTGASDVKVRAGMAYASLISGITLANAGLGIVHGLASQIGGYFEIPHGTVCGTLVAAATRINIHTLRNKNDADKRALQKYAKVGALLSGRDINDINHCCDLLIEKLQEWTELLQLPLLSDYGIQISHIDKIVNSAGMKNNPVKLGKDQIESILLSRVC
jgi:alcohol dehydrogenase class IV